MSTVSLFLYFTIFCLCTLHRVIKVCFFCIRQFSILFLSAGLLPFVFVYYSWGPCTPYRGRRLCVYSCLGLYAPGKASHDKQVRDKTKCSPKDPLWWRRQMVLGLPCPDAGYLGPLLARPGSEAWYWVHGDHAFAHGPAELSPKRLCENPVPLAHHLQEGPQGSVAMCIGWRSKAGTLVVQYLAAEASSRWNVTSLIRKEPELVHKLKKFWHHSFGLTSTHGKGTKPAFSRRVRLSSTLECPIVRIQTQTLASSSKL